VLVRGHWRRCILPCAPAAAARAGDVRSSLQLERQLMIYATNGSGNVKRLKGAGGCRLRIGDWRVIFIEDARSIAVIAVSNRREIYDREERIMNIRFKMTDKGEVAILPRKDYEAVAANKRRFCGATARVFCVCRCWRRKSCAAPTK
jgi:mRNA interferase RelE/StbE